mmetsp:Transcript_8422/g.20973  ORF Transcript_8422/g.20973 Transcript_8422/m.20973 type:complete len:215 (-) Transcript_8422:1421-2065(-)
MLSRCWYRTETALVLATWFSQSRRGLGWGGQEVLLSTHAGDLGHPLEICDLLFINNENVKPGLHTSRRDTSARTRVLHAPRHCTRPRPKRGHHSVRNSLRSSSSESRSSLLSLSLLLLTRGGARNMTGFPVFFCTGALERSIDFLMRSSCCFFCAAIFSSRTRKRRSFSFSFSAFSTSSCGILTMFPRCSSSLASMLASISRVPPPEFSKPHFS